VPGASNDGTSEVARRLTFVVALVGVALRLWQYGANHSQWLDEIAITRNILERSWTELAAAPLLYDQAAPRGFLLLERALATVFGPGDYVLRLVPTVGAVAAVLLLRRAAQRHLRGVAPFVAVALIAGAVSLIKFCSQVKQYSVDVGVAALLLALVLDLDERGASKRRAFSIGLIGAMAPWFSQAAVLELAAFSLVFLWRRWRRPTSASIPLGPLLTPWILSAAAATAVGILTVTPETQAYLREFWSGGLLPASLTEMLETGWPLTPLLVLIGSGWHASLNYPLPAAYVGLALIGFVSLWRTRPSAALLLAGPWVVTLAAAFARQYPFSDRLLLFLLPSFFLLVGEATEQLSRGLAQRTGPRTGPLVVALVVIPTLLPLLRTSPPYRLEDVNPALAHIHEAWQAGDRLYVYYGANPGALYYAPRHGFTGADLVRGGCHRGNNRAYLQELDALRGQRRVWLVFTHALPFYREREDMIGYLDAIGAQLEHFGVASRSVGFAYPGVDVYLYDLGEAARLGNASAATFETTGPNKPFAALACGHGPFAMVAPDSAR
jgi:hypothetical protein